MLEIKDQEQFIKDLLTNEEASLDFLTLSVDIIHRMALKEDHTVSCSLAKQLSALISPYRAFREPVGIEKIKFELLALSRLFSDSKKLCFYLMKIHEKERLELCPSDLLHIDINQLKVRYNPSSGKIEVFIAKEE